MITFTIDVEPGDIGETIKWVKQGESTNVPSCRLMDKFAQAFHQATQNKSLDLTKPTKIAFHERGTGRDLNEIPFIWDDADCTVDTKELAINKRWAVIDRAVRVAQFNAKKVGSSLTTANLDFIVVEVPELDTKLN